LTVPISIGAFLYMDLLEVQKKINKSISLASAAYKILPNILLSRLTPFAEETTRHHQCGF